MRSFKTIRSALLRAFVFAAVVLAGTGATLASLVAFPETLFTYVERRGEIELWSDRPIVKSGAQQTLSDALQGLKKSPLGLGHGPYRVFVANEDWRRRLLFLHMQFQPVGGIVFYPLSRRHAFLSGADFATGRLIAPTGNIMPPPRTLSYYVVHELTHVRIGETLGGIRFHLLPTWVQEGLADYVALGAPADFTQFLDAIGRFPPDLRTIEQHGVYPHYRALVSFYLERKGWSVAQLLATSLTYDDAMEEFRRMEPRAP